MRGGKLIGFGSPRGGAFVLQSFPPQLDALHRPQVRAGPLEPLVIAVAPLPVVNQHLLIIIVNLLNASRVPAREDIRREMLLGYMIEEEPHMGLKS